MDIAAAIEKLIPGAVYGGSVTAGTQEAYDNIRWEDSRTKPTWAELEAAWLEVEADLAKEALKERAQEELEKSDMVCIRCYKAGVAYPADWHARDEELRAIKRGTSTAAEIPTQLDYPEGT
ncbi:MAG: hypothetical protein A4E66_00003 [Syntrophus sp. PtaB.Bin001]|nr:MAG: hypothetical protein A4E66_00003 [Syntrophus sp. PtaB.Bin001]